MFQRRFQVQEKAVNPLCVNVEIHTPRSDDEAERLKVLLEDAVAKVVDQFVSRIDVQPTR